MKVTTLILIFLFSSSSFSQNCNYTSIPLITKSKELEDYVKDRYSEDKTQLFVNCSLVEKELIKESLINRKKATLEMLEEGNLILEGPIYDFVNLVYREIRLANPLISDKKIIILKNEYPNAFTMGEDIIYFHLGLLYRLQNKEQLAFILCHELAHDELNHFDKNIIEFVQFKTDKEKEKKIKEIYRNKYGHVSNLNKLLLPTLLVSSELSRRDELAADSLGMTYFKNVKSYSLERACTSFDVFLNSDHVRDTLELNFIEQLKLSKNIIDIEKLNNEKYESSLGAFDDIDDVKLLTREERDHLNDLLRTHPFEEERSINLYRDLNLEIPKSFTTSISDNYKIVRYLSEGEMVVSFFQKEEIGKALFYALNMKRNYPDDDFSNSSITLGMLTLYFYKKKFKEGIAIENQDEENDIAYDKLMALLKKLTIEECFNIGYELNKSNVYYSSEISTENIIIALIIDYKNLENEKFKLRLEEHEVRLKESPYWVFIKEMKYDVYKRVK